MITNKEITNKDEIFECMFVALFVYIGTQKLLN